MARTEAALGGCSPPRSLLLPPPPATLPLCHVSLASLPTVVCWLLPAGMLFDRQFMVVKESGGRFLTQRQFPKCAPCPPCCWLLFPRWVGM